MASDLIPTRRGAWPVAAAVALAVLCALPAPGRAQRNGDVSGGLNHQPTEGEVRSRERADDVSPPPGQRQQNTGTVDRLYQNLMGKEQKDGMTAPSANSAAPPADAGSAAAPAPRF